MKLRDKINDIKPNSDYAIYKPGSPVLVYNTHIEFPRAMIAEEIPAGVYYPVMDNKNDQFILSRFNPEALSKRHSEFGILFEELENSVPGMDFSTTGPHPHTILESSKETKYFPMEVYHAGLQKVDVGIDLFLSSRDFYIRHQLGYKRAVLLYGAPGTGKSRYIVHKCEQLIQKHQAIVIRIEGYQELRTLLHRGLFHLRDMMKDRLKVIVIEELATLVKYNDHTELLNLLDHIFLQDDMLFLMTTNTPEDIPENIVDRPSRVDILEEINTDGLLEGFIEAWHQFLLGEIMNKSWKYLEFYSKNLSPAYLKELFISTRINNTNVEATWKDIERRRNKVKTRFRRAEQMGF